MAFAELGAKVDGKPAGTSRHKLRKQKQFEARSAAEKLIANLKSENVQLKNKCSGEKPAAAEDTSKKLDAIAEVLFVLAQRLEAVDVMLTNSKSEPKQSTTTVGDTSQWLHIPAQVSSTAATLQSKWWYPEQSWGNVVDLKTLDATADVDQFQSSSQAKYEAVAELQAVSLEAHGDVEKFRDSSPAKDKTEEEQIAAIRRWRPSHGLASRANANVDQFQRGNLTLSADAPEFVPARGSADARMQVDDSEDASSSCSEGTSSAQTDVSDTDVAEFFRYVGLEETAIIAKAAAQNGRLTVAEAAAENKIGESIAKASHSENKETGSSNGEVAAQAVEPLLDGAFHGSAIAPMSKMELLTECMRAGISPEHAKKLFDGGDVFKHDFEQMLKER